MSTCGIAVFLIAAAAACAPEKQAPQMLAPSVHGVATAMIGTLEARLSAPDRAKIGSPISIVVDLVNRGDTAARITAPGGRIPFDVYVVSAVNDTVWRYPAPGEPRPATVLMMPGIHPGEQRSYGTATWDQTDLRGRLVQIGTYEISVAVVADAPWGVVRIGPVRVKVDR